MTVYFDLYTWTHQFRPVNLDLSFLTRLFWPVYLDPSIWTCLFGLFYLDYSILIHLFGTFYFGPSIWTRLFSPIYLAPSIWPHLFGPVSLAPSIWTCFFGPIYLDPSLWTYLFEPICFDLSLVVSPWVTKSHHGRYHQVMLKVTPFPFQSFYFITCHKGHVPGVDGGTLKKPMCYWGHVEHEIWVCADRGAKPLRSIAVDFWLSLGLSTSQYSHPYLWSSRWAATGLTNTAACHILG